MKKVVLLGGAGSQARECIRDLVANGPPSTIVIADRDGGGAAEVAALFDPSGERISAVEVDVSDRATLLSALQAASVVGNFVGPYYRWGAEVASAAVEVGVDYVDICDDDRASVEILRLHDDARRAGIVLLNGMGSGPGMTNVLAGVCAGNLDETTEAEFNWFASGHPASAGAAAFSHLLWGLSTPFEALIDGRLTVIQPYDESHARDVQFPDPFGLMRMWAFPHPEPVTFRHFIPTIATAINRGTAFPPGVMDILRTWWQLGCATRSPVEVDGRDVVPSDFAIAHFVQLGESLLGDVSSYPIHGSGMDIRIAGTNDGRPCEYRIRAWAETPMNEETGVPAAVGIAMLLDRKVATKGALAPECLDPSTVLSYMGARSAKRDQATRRSGLTIERTVDGDTERVRLRDLIATYSPPVVIA